MKYLTMRSLMEIAPVALLIAASAAFPRHAHAQGGIPLWTNRYDGPASGYDAPSSIAVNKDGVVYVTGASWRTNHGVPSDYITLAYSNDGTPLWTNRYPESGPPVIDSATGLGVDSEGNVIVTGATFGGPVTNALSAYTTIKYSSAGVLLWTNCFDPSTNGRTASALAVDHDDNVIVTGAAGIDRTNHYATVAYSTEGTALWTNLYFGPANAGDESRAIAVDSNGNVYVTGFSTGIGSAHDYATVAYSNSGVPLWTNRYNGPGNGDDEARKIAVDSSGNVYVTGSSAGIGTGLDFATIAYTSAGEPLWTNRLSGSGNGNDFPNGIAVDSHGDVFVTGTLFDPGFITIAYSSSGAPLWTNSYLGNHDAYSVAVDRNDNVFVAGYVRLPNNSTDFLILAYSNSGTPLWTNRYHGPQGGGYAYAMTVDSTGSVFVSGQSFGAEGYPDIATIKYSASIPQSPHLDFQVVNDQLVLSWTNSDFILQTAPTITNTFTDIVEATSPYTNSMTGPQQFFRLKSP